MNLKQLAKVQELLETISHQDNELILETLRKFGPLAFRDLHRNTRGSSAEIKERIDSLCATGVVLRTRQGRQTRFALDPERIKEINFVSQQICEIRKQGLRATGKR